MTLPLTDPPAQGAGFGRRLLVGQGLVLIAGALTTWVVATAVGPGIFHDHLERVGMGHTAEETRHIEEAFGSALLVSLSVAVMAAVIAALGVSWYFSQRVQGSIRPVATAASRIAEGHYEARVPDPGLGAEFATLSDTFNALAERLETVEATRRRMLADLAHEWRTPVATIDAHLEAIEDGLRHLDADTIHVLRQSTQRLRRLGEDIGAVSLVEEGRPSIRSHRVDPAALVTTATGAVGDRYAAKRVDLNVHLLTHQPLMADADRMGQALANLLDNALRHTPSGGAVTITCERVDDWIHFTVADTGEGIDPEHLPHVFDRFYRVDAARDRDHGGSGIGLSITKAWAEAHGGWVRAESQGPGHGATFILGVPLT